MQTIIKRNGIRVFKEDVRAISTFVPEVHDFFSRFGIEVTGDPEPGSITLHLSGGGSIDIVTNEPEKEATEWAVLLGWE